MQPPCATEPTIPVVTRYFHAHRWIDGDRKTVADADFWLDREYREPEASQNGAILTSMQGRAGAKKGGACGAAFPMGNLIP
jgi:hypothetical protein